MPETIGDDGDDLETDNSDWFEMSHDDVEDSYADWFHVCASVPVVASDSPDESSKFIQLLTDEEADVAVLCGDPSTMLSEAEVIIPELPLEILNPRERKPDELDDESSHRRRVTSLGLLMKLAGLQLDKGVASEDSTERNDLDFSEESESKIVVTCELSPDSEAVVKVFLSGVTSNGPKSLLILSDLLLYATCIGVENKGADFFSFILCLLVTGSFFSGCRRTSEREAGRNDTVLLEVIPISVDEDSSELAVFETLPLVYSEFEDRLDLLELVSIAFPKPV